MSAYFRYRISEPSIGRAEIDAVLRCLTAGELTQSGGASVAIFEARLALFLGVDVSRVVACSSGTAALHLALIAAGIGPGDRVAVPALTYVATVAALRYVGAVPVFVDVDERTWTIDSTALRVAAAYSGITAVLPVDLYGVPALDDLDELSRYKHLTIVRDTCQSFGGALNFDHTSVFSFYANKLITTSGEGGAVVAASAGLADDIRRLRGQGQSANRRYWHEVIGFNYRMTAGQAAFGTAQMTHVNDYMVARKSVADVYRDKLAQFECQRGPEGSASIDWLFSLLVPRDNDRDKIGTYLSSVHGIETRPVFPSIATMPPYVRWAVDLPVTDDIAARGISLPTHPQLARDDASTIARAFIEACNHTSTKKGA